MDEDMEKALKTYTITNNLKFDDIKAQMNVIRSKYDVDQYDALHKEIQSRQ